ncbi:MAG TPA: hypothetical protein VIF09_16780 [Polyangiaceae bacterium]
MIPRVLLLVLATVGAVASCSSIQDARIGVSAPDGTEQGFGPVSDFLDHRCGSLDCHGQPGRNLRVWGCEGMRLDPATSPASCNRANRTTVDEHQATFRSLVGLEPQVMSTVVQSHAHPELLTFVRKARGIEAHKGGAIITPGDDQDICITSWLGVQIPNDVPDADTFAGATDTSACSRAQGLPQFPILDASAE